MPCSRCKAATIELPSGRCEHGTPNEFDRGVARLVTESVQAACERATTDGHLKHRSTIVNRRFAASQARNPPESRNPSEAALCVPKRATLWKRRYVSRNAQPFGSGVMCPETRNPSEAALCVPKRATLRKRRYVPKRATLWKRRYVSRNAQPFGSAAFVCVPKRATLRKRRYVSRNAQPFGSGVMCPETRNPSEAAFVCPETRNPSTVSLRLSCLSCLLPAHTRLASSLFVYCVVLGMCVGFCLRRHRALVLPWCGAAAVPLLNKL
jgi:hypothetical protein